MAMKTYTTQLVDSIHNGAIFIDGVLHTRAKVANGDAPTVEVNGEQYAPMADDEYTIVFGPVASQAELLPINPVEDFWTLPARDLDGNWYQVYIGD